MSSAESEIHASYGHGQVADLAGRRTYEQAWTQFAREQTPEEFCRNWFVIQSQAIGGVSDGVVILLNPATASFAPVAFFPAVPRDRTHLAQISEHALREARGIVEPQGVTRASGH